MVGQKPIQVVADLVEEALQAVDSIEATLDGVALAAWRTFKVSWDIIETRVLC